MTIENIEIEIVLVSKIQKINGVSVCVEIFLWRFFIEQVPFEIEICKSEDFRLKSC